MCNPMSRRFELGEKKVIEWEIVPNRDIDTVVVTDAKFEVFSGSEVIKLGNATVNGMNVSCLFDADTVGSFTLRLSVTVPPETIKTEIYITVTG